MYKRNGNLLNSKYKEYLLPTIISAMSILLSSIIDGIIVGNLIGADALSAVNLSQPVVLFFQALFFLIGIGGSTIVSIAKGQRKSEKANKVFTVACVFAILFSVLFIVLGSLFLDNMVALICSDESLVALVREYVRIYVFGAPFMIIVPSMVYFIRTDGMPKLSANILLIANVVNLFLDIVYIQVFKLGITGASLATVTGYIVGFFIVLIYIFSKKRTLSFTKIKLKDLAYIGEITGGGIASTTNTVLLFLKTLLINHIVLVTVGADGMAVFSVCNFAISFVSMFISGGADTMVPIMGMLFGAKDIKGMKFILRKTFTIVLVSCVATIILMELFPLQILSLFAVTSATQIAIGIPALRIFALCLLGAGISIIMMNYLQTIKQKSLSVMIAFLRGLVILVPCAYIAATLLGATGIWLAFVIAETLTVLITFSVCKIKAKLSKNKYKGVFLFEKFSDEEKIFDATIKGNLADAVNISHEISEFCSENNISEKNANFMGILAEEAVAHIKNYNDTEKEVCIDIMCKFTFDKILLSLRDDGKPFNTTLLEPENQEKFSNIHMISSIAEDLEYTRTLGLNNTVIILSRQVQV